VLARTATRMPLRKSGKSSRRSGLPTSRNSPRRRPRHELARKRKTY
jgi:hypothetical protein